MDYYFGNPNPPNPYYGHQYSAVNIAPSSDNFMVSDYLMLDDDDVVNVDHHHHQDSNWSQSTETESSENKAGSSDANIHGFGDETSPNNNNMQVLNFFLSLSVFPFTVSNYMIYFIMYIYEIIFEILIYC